MSETSRATAYAGQLAQVMPAGWFAMSLLGAATTVYGPILPYVAAEAGQPVASAGALIALHWLGFFLSTACANALARHWGLRRALAAGCGLIGLGALGLLALPFPASLAAAVPIGFGAGVLEILFNRLVESLAGAAPAAALTRLHATWGVGAVIMPLAVAGAAAASFGWRAAGAGLVAAAAAGASLILRWPEVTLPPAGAVVWRGLPWRSLLVFTGMLIVYVGAETAVGGWATTFFAGLGQGPVFGAVATAVFFLTFTFARLTLAPVTDRLGLARSVQLGTGLGSAALLLTLFPTLAIVGFGLSGLAFSVVFPTLLAWAARRHPDIRAQVASLSIAAAGVGGVTLPYLMGLGVERWGTSALPAMLISAALSVLAASFLEPAPQ